MCLHSCPMSGAPDVRIVLCMVVKSEERVIERCLRAALPHVDALFLSSKRPFPILIMHQPWKDFGHNRTLAADTARWWIDRELGWPLERTYLLLLDADMVLVADPRFDRQTLSAPHYHVEQRGGQRYMNTRLIRLSHQWRCIGATHEYWAPTPDVQPVPLRELFIDDRGDGGSKADKFERDLALLTKGLEAEPDNVRYMFYLAQTLFDLGRFGEAAKLYQRRIAAGGWDEERWYALYRMGMAFLRMGDESQGTMNLLLAHEQRPERAEPLVALARHHRMSGKSNLASLFAERALDMPLPSDILFVEPAAYTTEPLEELMVAAYYTPHKEPGRRAAERLLAERGHPPARYEHAAQCASFYLEPVRSTLLGRFDVSRELRARAERFLGLGEPNTVEYLPKNPTIADLDGRTFVNVCLVNYHHERGVVFAPKDADGIVRTRSAILEWDPESATIKSERESAITLPESWDPKVGIRGLEDQRWTSRRGRIWLTATCFHPHGRAEVVLGRMAEDMSGPDHLTTLRYKRATGCEKNWLPFSAPGVDGVDELYLIYSYDPFIVVRVLDLLTGQCEEVSCTVPPMHASRWRGSCPPILQQRQTCTYTDDLYLAAIHETARFGDRTVYMHRLIELQGGRTPHGPPFSITRCSRLFCWDHPGVEYAMGLRWKGTSLIVTYGSEEREARWLEIDALEVERMLSEGVR